MGMGNGKKMVEFTEIEESQDFVFSVGELLTDFIKVLKEVLA